MTGSLVEDGVISVLRETEGVREGKRRRRKKRKRRERREEEGKGEDGERRRSEK